MVLKLDSRVAVVWRDPFSIQFGVDPARIVLREVSSAEERMIAALEAGVSRSGLDMIAKSSGAGEPEVVSLLRRLRSLLLSDAPAPTAPAVAIAGSGPTAQRIASALGLAGVRVSLGATVSEQDCDLGIAIGHYVLDPDSYGFWLRRDRPHLAVVFGDDSVTMGPVVEPGRTPCLYCLEHYRRDDDAAWPAIASQLWGRRSTSETPLVSAEVAVRVTRMVLNRLEHGSVIRHSAAARSFRLAVDTGEVTRREWMPHPDCGCIRLPPLPTGEPVSEDRRESGSPRGLDRPTTVAGAAEPA